MVEQARWADHAAFMNRLADEGFVVLGGPLGDGKKILLIVDAQTEEAVHARLAADPWMQIELLRVAKKGENAAHPVPAALAIGDRGPCAEERTSPSGAGMRRMALFTPPGMN